MVKLMGVYAESNRENAAYFYPDCADISDGIKKVENDFLTYLQKEFFVCPENTYCVMEKDTIWVSALRLYVMKDCYYIEALETSPMYRRRGYGAELLDAVLISLKKKGPFILRDNVGKRNAASLATHRKCGFEVEHEDAVNYLSSTVNPACYGLIYRFGTEQNGAPVPRPTAFDGP